MKNCVCVFCYCNSSWSIYIAEFRSGYIHISRCLLSYIVQSERHQNKHHIFSSAFPGYPSSSTGITFCDVSPSTNKAQVRHCGLVGSAPAWDGTGREFDSWQCRIYIPCSLSLRLLGSLWGSLGTYGLTQKLC